MKTHAPYVHAMGPHHQATAVTLEQPQASAIPLALNTQAKLKMGLYKNKWSKIIVVNLFIILESI